MATRARLARTSLQAWPIYSGTCEFMRAMWARRWSVLSAITRRRQSRTLRGTWHISIWSGHCLVHIAPLWVLLMLSWRYIWRESTWSWRARIHSFCPSICGRTISVVFARSSTMISKWVQSIRVVDWHFGLDIFLKSNCVLGVSGAYVRAYKLLESIPVHWVSVQL